MGNFFEGIGNAIVWLSNLICGYPLFLLLIGGGLFFLIYSGFVPFRYYGRAIKSLREKEDAKDE